jgi:hypothetical protein
LSLLSARLYQTNLSGSSQAVAAIISVHILVASIPASRSLVSAPSCKTFSTAVPLVIAVKLWQIVRGSEEKLA